MKKLFVNAVLFFCVIVCQAQKFVCTDINFVGRGLNQQAIRKEKEKMLGIEAELTIYDNSLRLSYKIDGIIESYIFDKIKDNEYQLIDRISKGKNRRKVIKLKKIIAYINGFTFDSYLDKELQAIGTFKRK